MSKEPPQRETGKWGGPWGVACMVIAGVGLPASFLLFLHYSAKYPHLSDSEGLRVFDMPMPDRLIMASAFFAPFAGISLCIVMGIRAGKKASISGRDD